MDINEKNNNGNDINVSSIGNNIEEDIKIALDKFSDNKDIEILENLLEEGFEAMCYPEAQAIEHLIQAYKELEEENMQLEAIKDEAIRRYNFESIPVSLVEEKIEEIQKEYEETLKTANFKEIEKMNKINFRGITLEGQRSILQELLEKR